MNGHALELPLKLTVGINCQSRKNLNILIVTFHLKLNEYPLTA